MARGVTALFSLQGTRPGNFFYSIIFSKRGQISPNNLTRETLNHVGKSKFLTKRVGGKPENERLYIDWGVPNQM